MTPETMFTICNNGVIPAWLLLVVPCLFLTLMAGPIGFLLYAILRVSLRKTATLVEG